MGIFLEMFNGGKNTNTNFRLLKSNKNKCVQVLLSKKDNTPANHFFFYP